MVRAATLADVEGLIELTKEIPSRYGLDDLAPYSPEKTELAYLKGIQDNLCYLTEKEGEIVSVLLLGAQSAWWSEKPYLQNHILYAKSGEFNYNLLKKYVKIIEYIAEKNNVPFLFDMFAYEHEGQSDIDKKERMFLKLFKGSKKLGTILRIN